MIGRLIALYVLWRAWRDRNDGEWTVVSAASSSVVSSEAWTDPRTRRIVSVTCGPFGYYLLDEAGVVWPCPPRDFSAYGSA